MYKCPNKVCFNGLRKPLHTSLNDTTVQCIVGHFKWVAVIFIRIQKLTIRKHDIYFFGRGGWWYFKRHSSAQTLCLPSDIEALLLRVFFGNTSSEFTTPETCKLPGGWEMIYVSSKPSGTCEVKTKTVVSFSGFDKENYSLTSLYYSQQQKAFCSILKWTFSLMVSWVICRKINFEGSTSEMIKTRWYWWVFGRKIQHSSHLHPIKPFHLQPQEKKWRSSKLVFRIKKHCWSCNKDKMWNRKAASVFPLIQLEHPVLVNTVHSLLNTRPHKVSIQQRLCEFVPAQVSRVNHVESVFILDLKRRLM